MEELVVRFLQGRATPAEKEELLRWRRLDPANERRYRELTAVWDLTGAAAPEPSGVEKPPFDAVLRRVREAAAGQPASGFERPPAGTGRRSLRRHRVGGWVGGGLLAASVAALALMRGGAPGADPGAALAPGQIVTGAGESTTVTLADGTSIRLGPSSRLRMRYEGADVLAELEGRAFFAVRSDSSRAFVVRTASGDATVRGTRFEVRSDEEEPFRVLVVDGLVRVAAAGASVELGEAAMSRLAPGDRLATARVADVYGQLGWMGNTLVFQNTPLPKALAEIRHRFGLEVVLEDEGLGSLTITASFTDQTVDEVVLVLCGMLGAECTVDDGRAIIAAPSPARTVPVP